MEELCIDGKTFRAWRIPTGHASLLLIMGERGMLGCGYFSVATADKVGDLLAVVTGVSSHADMLEAKVVAVSAAAAATGLTPGLTGREALKLL